MGRKPVYAVVGAGNSGLGLAADLGNRGFEVRMFDLEDFAASLQPIALAGGIKLRGARGEGFVPISMVTTDAGKAIGGANAILCSVPAYGHRRIARALAPHLRDGDVVVLMPGCCGGAIEFTQEVRAAGNTSGMVVAEASSFIFACKKEGADGVWIRGVKDRLPLAAFPARSTGMVLERIGPAYPQCTAARNVLETSLNNANHPLHAPAALLNVGRIEFMGGDWSFYHEGMTPAVCRLMEALDRERLAIATAYGLPQLPLLEMITGFYAHQGVAGATLYDTLSKTPVHGAARAPSSVGHRYLTEDVPFGLVPMSSLGQLAGVPTPIMHGVSTVAGAVVGRDFFAEGRTARSLGLAGKTVEQVLEYVER